MSENTEEKKKSDIAVREDEILSFWQSANIFKKTIEKDAPQGEFVFYDGPPFATGLPHFGHILPTSIKDVIPRYKTMQGFRVQRRWGWDCHGLPIENLIQDTLGLRSKKDIQEYGIEKFNNEARNNVLRYRDEWKKIIPRLGRFVDMENDYRTMDASFMASELWAFKEIYDKGLLYEGYKSMHYCPHCETPLSNFEVNQGYKYITDISVVVRLPLVDEENTSLLAWTTTPWTLPGNTAAAVNKDVVYVCVESDGEKFILAKKKLSDAGLGDAKICDEFLGSELIGKRYTPPFDYFLNIIKENVENAWRVYHAPYVSEESGTGIVHLAPAFGEEDLDLAKEHAIPFIHHVDLQGAFVPDVKDFAGHIVKPKDTDDAKDAHQMTDIEVIKNLAHRGILFKKEKIVHSYPHCWRCNTPLLYYAMSSWFIAVSKMRDALVKENAGVNWIPREIGEGRFGKWLEGAHDWAISRQRFWGTPLPIWKCDTSAQVDVLGSVDDIKAKTKSTNTYFVMRHGEAENNTLRVVSSHKDTEHHLTKKGESQIQESIAYLKDTKIDVIIASPLLRTKETAELVAKGLGMSTADIVYDDRIQEVQAGDLDGKGIEEYYNYFIEADIFTKQLPHGENYADIKRRMGDCIYDIDKKYEGKNILFISHESPLWLLFAAVQGLDEEGSMHLFDSLHNPDAPFIKNAEVRALDFAPIPHNADYELDFHRPYIDEITYASKYGGVMRRIPDVLDTWFNSGSVPYASNQYTGVPTDDFNLKTGKGFPADFIGEGIDQTRGWFYTLLILNTALFNQSPYKNVAVNGIILAEDGRKMSKSLKNYPDLMETVYTYSADALRYFLISSPAVRAEESAFSAKGVDEVMKKLQIRLNNVLAFYKLYDTECAHDASSESTHILDKWILARLYTLLDTMTRSLDAYELDRASRPVADFIDDLSTWYIRRSRDRFKSEERAEMVQALQTLRFVLREFSKLLAPIMPFMAEHIFLAVRASDDVESVHLTKWPDPVPVDGALLESMELARLFVTKALEERAKHNLKVRQPLAYITLRKKEKDALPPYWSDIEPIILDEVNIKEIYYQNDEDVKDVVFDGINIVLTPALKEEGIVRDMIRAIQEARKNAKTNPLDAVILSVVTGDDGSRFIEKNKEALIKGANLKDILLKEGEGNVSIGDYHFYFSINTTH